MAGLASAPGGGGPGRDIGPVPGNAVDGVAEGGKCDGDWPKGGGGLVGAEFGIEEGRLICKFCIFSDKVSAFL